MKYTFLICELTKYSVQYEINPWVAGNIRKVDHKLATKQQNNLVDLLNA